MKSFKLVGSTSQGQYGMIKEFESMEEAQEGGNDKYLSLLDGDQIEDLVDVIEQTE